MQAEQAFNKTETTSSYKDYNLAQTEYYDIPYQAQISCENALTEWQEANSTIANDHAFINNETIKSDKASAEASLIASCNYTASQLNPATS
jgi:hypothetical protein